ncbi:MAG TPA: undecaprenyl-diphosphatase UppP [Candidatus Eisenbacteria bacterium]|nr:undecaprenyl-diphosphatase UppP [Candidatus Eisenbacteria bacterium]
MNLLHAALLGIVEGVTEFLPVSSTGHLILASRLLGLEPTEFVKSFEIAIQLGAILAVVALYGRTLLARPPVLRRVLAAFVPTAAAGFVLYKIVKRYLLSNDRAVLWALFLGGIALIAFELFHKERETDVEDLGEIPYRHCVLIGLCQAAAIFPGVSRSAATILGGLSLRLKRKAIVEFSFLLAVPTMLAATALDLLKSAHSFSAGEFRFLAVGAVVSFAVAALSIRFLLRFVRSHTFIPFGFYRIFAALAFWFLR